MNKQKIFEYDNNSISSIQNMGMSNNNYIEMTRSQQLQNQVNRPSNKINEQNRQSLVHEPQTYKSTSSQNYNTVAEYTKNKHSIYNEQSSFVFSTNKRDQSQELDLSSILQRLSQREQTPITYVPQQKQDNQQQKQQMSNQSQVRSRSKEQAPIFGSSKKNVDQIMEQYKRQSGLTFVERSRSKEQPVIFIQNKQTDQLEHQKRNLSSSLQREPQKNVYINDTKSNQNFVTINQSQQFQSFTSQSPPRERSRSRKIFPQQNTSQSQGLRTSLSPAKTDQSYVTRQSWKNNVSRQSKNELSMMVDEYNSMIIIPHGFKGLPNIGNSCFMNSVLQCLFNLQQFNDYFQADLQKQLPKTHSNISLNYNKVLIQIKNFEDKKQSKTLPNTQDLKNSIEKRNRRFNYQQQDAQEFLRVLLSAIHDDLNKVTEKQKYKSLKSDPSKHSFSKIADQWWNYFKESDNSIVTDIFQGQLMNKVHCNVCKFQSVAFDNFLDLSLSFAPNLKDINIYNLINQFFDEEQQEEKRCQTCKCSIKPLRKFFLWRLPDVLVIHLKRYKYDKNLNQPSFLGGQQKLTHKIRFPLQNLDLTKYVKESTHISTLKCFYDLAGVVHHNGNMLGGHYTADCMSFQDDKWYNINDTQVKQIDIQKQAYLKDGSDSPFLLFYIKNSKKR